MGQIGEPQRTIIVEPAEDPIPTEKPVREPIPRKEPTPQPTPKKVPEKETS